MLSTISREDLHLSDEYIFNVCDKRVFYIHKSRRDYRTKASILIWWVLIEENYRTRRFFFRLWKKSFSFFQSLLCKVEGGVNTNILAHTLNNNICVCGRMLYNMHIYTTLIYNYFIMLYTISYILCIMYKMYFYIHIYLLIHKFAGHFNFTSPTMRYYSIYWIESDRVLFLRHLSFVVLFSFS